MKTFDGRFFQFLRLACGLAAVASLGLWGTLALLRLRFTPAIDYGEGLLLHAAQQFQAGVFPYSWEASLPYVPVVYGPLYPLVWALILPWTGPVLWGGRLIAVLGALACAGWLAFTVRRLTGRWLEAAVAAGLFLWSGPSVAWTALARVDFPALALGLGGLALFLFAAPRYRVVGTALFFLALLTRQTMLAAPLVAYLHLYREGDRKTAALHALALFGLVLGALAVLQVGSHGGFWREAVAGNVCPWQWERLRWLGGFMVRRSPLLLVVGVVGVPLLWRRTPQMWALSVYAVIALLSMVLGAKQGAGRNYLLEAVWACALIMALALSPRLLWREPRRWQLWLPAVLILLQFGLLYRAPGLYTDLSRGSDPIMDAALIEAVRAEPGEVLSENLGAAVAAGKRVWVEPSTTTQMAWADRWDQEPLLEMIRQHRFGLVVTSTPLGPPHAGFWGYADRWTAEEGQALEANYAPGERLGIWQLWRPVPQVSH